MTRVWIAAALWCCGMILSLLGIIAAKRTPEGEAIDWLRLWKSASLTAGGAIVTASIWPLAAWNWAPGDAVAVIASGFGLNAGLTKGLQVLFPKRT